MWVPPRGAGRPRHRMPGFAAPLLRTRMGGPHGHRPYLPHGVGAAQPSSDPRRIRLSPLPSVAKRTRRLPLQLRIGAPPWRATAANDLGASWRELPEGHPLSPSPKLRVPAPPPVPSPSVWHRCAPISPSEPWGPCFMGPGPPGPGVPLPGPPCRHGETPSCPNNESEKWQVAFQHRVTYS